MTNSASCSPLSSLQAAPEKYLSNTITQIAHNDKPQTMVSDESSTPGVLEIVPDNDSPTKKMSAFLISTPSSTTTSSSASSSATSNNTHFNYDEAPHTKIVEPTPSTFNWPSQFRRQLSLNVGGPSLNPLPATPYTPPPMLSPFRKGPGLYYRVFSHPGSSAEPSSIPTTPILPVTPIGEESSGPKINIGREYQAIIPKLRTELNYDDTGL